MNENLNLVEILKNCPKGMELDSPMFDNVTFDGIIDDRLYPIEVGVGGVNTMTLTKYGQYTDKDFAKCIIFPKGETTWEEFVPPNKFKDGDIVATNNGNWIGITKGGCVDSFIPTYCVLGNNREVKLYFGRKAEWDFNRLATEEEKQKLFQAIKAEGYKWNAETKTFERLVKPKFDPKTLKAFDRVLTRDSSNAKWSCNLFSHIDKKSESGCPYVCEGFEWRYCIPYNEETKHLRGTTDEAPEYYRYWEE